MQSELVRLVNCSALITLSLDNLVPGTTGQKVTTLKVPSWWIKFWMLSAARLRDATAFKGFRLLTHLEVVLVPAWVPC